MSDTLQNEWKPTQSAQSLLSSLELMELGLEIKKANIKRTFPTITDEEVLLKLNEWLQEPPAGVILIKQ